MITHIFQCIYVTIRFIIEMKNVSYLDPISAAVRFPIRTFLICEVNNFPFIITIDIKKAEKFPILHVTFNDIYERFFKFGEIHFINIRNFRMIRRTYGRIHIIARVITITDHFSLPPSWYREKRFYPYNLE